MVKVITNSITGVFCSSLFKDITNRGSILCTIATQVMWEVIPCKDTDSNLQVQMYTACETQGSAHIFLGFVYHQLLQQQEHNVDISTGGLAQLATGLQHQHHC